MNMLSHALLLGKVIRGQYLVERDNAGLYIISTFTCKLYVFLKEKYVASYYELWFRKNKPIIVKPRKKIS